MRDLIIVVYMLLDMLTTPLGVLIKVNVVF
jgi:hypothetical protein